MHQWIISAGMSDLASVCNCDEKSGAIELVQLGREVRLNKYYGRQAEHLWFCAVLYALYSYILYYSCILYLVNTKQKRFYCWQECKKEYFVFLMRCRFLDQKAFLRLLTIHTLNYAVSLKRYHQGTAFTVKKIIFFLVCRRNLASKLNWEIKNIKVQCIN